MKKKAPATCSSSSDDEDEPMEVDNDSAADSFKEVSDAESLQLISEFKTNVTAFEEFAMEFVSSKIDHPVVSCFRELSGIDVNFILSNVNKLKRKLGTLEQGTLYLGLIDFLAIICNNALYVDERQRGVKKIPQQVQKIMIEFKNIIGFWGLSENGQFKNRCDLVMQYLRRLVIHFQAIGFDLAFVKILDTLDREIIRNRHSSEMIKAMSTINTGVKSNSSVSKEPQQFNENENATELEIIAQNIDLKMDIANDLDDNEEEEEEIPLNTNDFIASDNINKLISKTISSFFKKKEKQERNLIKPVKKTDNTKSRDERETEVKKQSRGQKLQANKAKKTLVTNDNDDPSAEISPSKYSSQLARINKTNKKISSSDAVGKNANSIKKTHKLVTISHPNPLEVVNLSPAKEESKDTSPRKKPRLLIENIENQAIVQVLQKQGSTISQPKVNAFALLMQKSKELAKLSKQKKIKISSK